MAIIMYFYEYFMLILFYSLFLSDLWRLHNTLLDPGRSHTLFAEKLCDGLWKRKGTKEWFECMYLIESNENNKNAWIEVGNEKKRKIKLISSFSYIENNYSKIVN